MHNLEQILPRFKVGSIDDATKQKLNLAWHRLDAWPDVSVGLNRLKRKFMIAPVSNGNISLMVALARRNDLPWDAILGSEIAGDFKPKPRVYLSACEAFDVAPAQCMMAAAHPNDLSAAAACVESDGKTTFEESDVLAAIAAALACPVPIRRGI
jgi:2-haloacid dehalogenase